MAVVEAALYMYLSSFLCSTEPLASQSALAYCASGNGFESYPRQISNTPSPSLLFDHHLGITKDVKVSIIQPSILCYL